MMPFFDDALHGWCITWMMPCFDDALLQWWLALMIPYFHDVFEKKIECNFNKKLPPLRAASAIRRKFITSKWILFPKRSALIAAVPH